MKNLSLFCLLIACIGLQSCKKNKTNVEVTKIQDEKPISVTCYEALYENDTIDLKINTLKNGKITGNMTMKLADIPKRQGKLLENFMETLYW